MPDCTRKVHTGTELIYRAVPDGSDEEINVQGHKPGLHTAPAGWTPYWSGGDYPTSMGWHPDYDVPILWLRAAPGEPIYSPCDGTVAPIGAGTSTTGIAHRWVGCDRCGWTQRERLSEPVTEPLFEDA